jgi:hypothetical protein
MSHEEEIWACSPLLACEQAVDWVRSNYRYEFSMIAQEKDTKDFQTLI